MYESTQARQRRIQLLVRQNRGRKEFKTYFEDLAELLKRQIATPDRIDLETTDLLFTALEKGRQESLHSSPVFFQKTWTYEPTQLWLDACALTADALRGTMGVLFVGPYKYCGAVRVAPDRALQVASSLLDLDGDTLILGSSDGCTGLSLDKFEEHSVWFSELVVWGEWAKLIAPAIAT